MPSIKKLASVCHNITHHAVSGLSFIHPHLSKACREAGLKSIIVDLKRDDPCPERFKTIKPLRLSLQALKKKFEEIFQLEGFVDDDITGMVLEFYLNDGQDDYSMDCRACLVARSGKIFRSALDCLGNKIADSCA
jgi:hypothetical protein